MPDFIIEVSEYFLDLFANFQAFLDANPWFVPLSAFLLPFLEALLPWLPLTAIISYNHAILSDTYGAELGTFYTIILSVMGSFVGMLIIFLIIRVTIAKFFIKRVENNEFGKKFISVVDNKNFGLALVLLSNPFLPSSIMNYGLSLTKVSISKYALLTFLSRVIIIVFFVFLGSIFNIQTQPWNVIWLMLFYLVLFGGVAIYRRIQSKRTSK
ncbi:MAG: VTT domain-containing protein [Candidatus Izemoplasmatales bacterium]|jgi:uncharacterized membrane protein YdjX (TVP38/TMEM64 family)|nr:VTT domain-containing protein [Candidatus Izemoplasmatales bacterium]